MSMIPSNITQQHCTNTLSQPSAISLTLSLDQTTRGPARVRASGSLKSIHQPFIYESQGPFCIYIPNITERSNELPRIHSIQSNIWKSEVFRAIRASPCYCDNLTSCLQRLFYPNSHTTLKDLLYPFSFVFRVVSLHLHLHFHLPASSGQYSRFTDRTRAKEIKSSP